MRPELEWAAGFYCGEGCTTSQAFQSYRPHLSMSQSDPDLEALMRFQKAVGKGKIRGPYAASKSGNPVWRFNAAYMDTLIIMDQLWPYLTRMKKRQFLTLLLKYRQVHQGRKRWVQAVDIISATRFARVLEPSQ